MKIIDQTPFYDNETGQISMVNKAKAMMKFGSVWLGEAEAQKSVIPALDNVLDKNYTLLRNITLPGLDASIPFILIGPPGVYVIYVAHLTGMYRAKNDQWGTVSGNNFKPEKPNLLARTERMARAIQVFLQRQKYADLVTVEPILLCADLGAHVDSLRPIVRVVMRDALERFAVSITQAHVVLSPEAVHDLSNRILKPPKPVSPAAEEAAGAADASATILSQSGEDQSENAYIPAFTVPDAEPSQTSGPAWAANRMSFKYEDTAPEAGASADQETLPAQAAAFVESPEAASDQSQDNPFPFPDTPQPQAQARKRRGLTRGQMTLLIVFGVFELILLAVFGFILISNFM